MFNPYHNEDDDDDDEFAYHDGHADEYGDKDSYSFEKIDVEKRISLNCNNSQTQGSLENLNLATRKFEIKTMIIKIRENLDRDDDNDPITLTDLIDMHFGKQGQQWMPWMTNVKKIFKAVLKDCKKHGQHPHLMAWELDSYIEATLILHIYGLSPENLWDSASTWYHQPLMPKDRFLYIQHQLASFSKGNNSNHQSHWNSRELSKTQPDLSEAWTLLGQTFQKIAFEHDVTTISLDDEKQHMRSTEVLTLGMARGFQRGGNPGPYIIMAFAKNLGILLSAELSELALNITKKLLQRRSHFLVTNGFTIPTPGPCVAQFF